MKICVAIILIYYISPIHNIYKKLDEIVCQYCPHNRCENVFARYLMCLPLDLIAATLIGFLEIRELLCHS